MKLKEITDFLESLAPISYQEAYDNSGLQIGNPEMIVEKVLILDSPSFFSDAPVFSAKQARTLQQTPALAGGEIGVGQSELVLRLASISSRG